MTTLKNLSPEYKYGFSTQLPVDQVRPGLDKDVISFISKKKNEPSWLLDMRLKAYEYWLGLRPPDWGHLTYDPIDFNKISYYSAPKQKKAPKSLDELSPELLKTFKRLGIPISEQKRITGVKSDPKKLGVAFDLVFDSVSLGTTHGDLLAKHGVIFCSISEAIQKHPDLVKKYFGSVVPYTDNFYAALNAAVFTDGSFCYIPKGVRCPIDLSTYFRINAAGTGQFERTLVVAEEGGFVNYLEGCTAPQRDEHQLHAAVVELVALEDATIRYSTVQNWYTGDKEGRGGVYNFVTKRGKCAGRRACISWTQVESGSAITWKYPSVILQGEGSVGKFYSVALTHDYMQADTGTKMIHIGPNTKSTIVSKGISTDQSVNSYRGMVKVMPSAKNARNYSQCDSMLVGDNSQANTYPRLDIKNPTAVVEHEASTSKLSEEQLFYLNTRGLNTEQAVSLLVNGFCQKVFKQLPLEFSVEAVNLIEMKLENSVG